MTIKIVNTYGAQHETSPSNPNHVTGGAGYRATLTGTITPELAGFDELVKFLDLPDANLHTRPEGYGVVFLESEEHSISYFGPVEQVLEYQRLRNAGEQPQLDASQGHLIERWPSGNAWDKVIPASYWNVKAAGAIDDGIGIVTAFAHNAIPGAEVIVYEYEGTWGMGDKEPRRMVTYHCTGCHKDTLHDSGHMRENKGPTNRRWMARKAREHITGAVRHGLDNENQLCRPGSHAHILHVANRIASANLGPGYIPHSEDEGTFCATKGPCSIIRDLRAGVRPAPYGR